MSEPSDLDASHSVRRVTLLLRTLIGVTLLLALIIAITLGKTIRGQASQRDALMQQHARMMQNASTFTNLVAALATDITAALDTDKNLKQAHVQSTLRKLDEVSADLLGGIESSPGEPVGADLAAHVRNARQLFTDVLAWRDKHLALDTDIRNELTVGRVRAILNKLQTDVDSAIGRQRIHYALQKLERDRKTAWTGGAVPDRSGMDIMPGVSMLTNIKLDLIDTRYLVEHLDGARSIDSLTDIRDNQLKSNLEHLQRALAQFDTPPVDMRMVQELMVSLFGAGYLVDNEHQTIHAGPGGLYTQRQQYLESLASRDRMRERLLSIIGDLSLARDRLMDLASKQKKTLEQQVAQKLTTAWQHTLLTGAAGILLFLLISFQVLRAIRKQVIWLNTTRDRAAEASRVKSEFLATMSHEIRTPLNGVLGMLELLSRGELQDRQKRLADTARRSAKTLLGIINDILDFSRIEAGKLQLVEENFDLGQLLDDTLEMFSCQAEARDIKLVQVLPPTLPPLVRGDVTRLRQVLVNLVGNAVKFTDAGEVRLQLELDAETESRINLKFCIADTGPGIPEDQQAHIFETFTQVDSTPARHHGGTGLGLAISRQLVELMGGSIHLQSREGEGSRFCFNLPVTVVHASTPSPEPSGMAPTQLHRHPAARILLAEDNQVNQEVALGLLEILGYRPDVVSNGAEVIEAMERNHYDLLLMDCHMPDMDGFAAARKIRQQEQARADGHIPIIALTADVRKDIRAQCLDAGMDAYLSKPFSVEQLSRVLQQWLPVRDSQRPDEAESPPQNPDAVIDPSVLDQLRRLGERNHRDVLGKVAGLYINEAGGLLERLRHGIEARNSAEVSVAAHTLKSCSANVGAMALSGTCARMEQAGRASEYSRMPELLREIDEKLKQVLAALREVTAPEPLAPEPVTREGNSRSREQRILVVDDDAAYRCILREVLEAEGFRVEEAESGLEALEKADSARPDLILLDEVMDGIDGFETCRRLKAHPTLRRIPVLMATGLDDAKSVNQAFNAGASGFITKPVNHPILIQNLHFTLRASKAEEHIRNMAFFDTLTGVASRNYLMQHIDEAIKTAKRRKESFTLFFLDLDGFKDINDTLGHDAGDRLLTIIGQRLKGALRDSDLVARLGGDEFCILTDNIAHEDSAARMADTYLKVIGEPLEIEGRTLTPRVSIGIARYPNDATSVSELLKAADSAMYAAKEAGKCRFAFYDRKMTLRAEQRMATEHELQRAIANHEFELLYQPQIAFDHGKLVGVEALVRWRHPIRGRVGPDEFIPVLERMGLIQELGDWVLRTATLQALEWHRQGLGEIRMAVNLSPLQCEDERLLHAVSDLLEETGISPDLLELEITESAVQTGGGVIKTLGALRDLGVKTAIDDFGTGYSALGSLKNLPVDRLKIDRSFVKDMPTDPQDRLLVETIITLAHAMNYTVIAEGVETMEHVRLLADLGCDLAQGYYFSKPADASEIPALVNTDLMQQQEVERIIEIHRGGK